MCSRIRDLGVGLFSQGRTGQFLAVTFLCPRESKAFSGQVIFSEGLGSICAG